NDNAAGVATLLETARALSADGPPVNPVLLLFSDAEEFGLLGAKAFVESHAWAADVGFVMNFDARGRAGPSVMFETGPGSAWIVERLAKTVSHPVAASFMTAVYMRMPNSTDFTVFRDAAVPGLNFAYIRDPAVYHSVRDTTAAVELGAMQHH